MSDKNFVDNYLKDFSKLLKPNNEVVEKIVEAKNEEHQMYYVRDIDLGREFWVPMADVAVGEIVENENY